MGGGGGGRKEGDGDRRDERAEGAGGGATPHNTAPPLRRVNTIPTGKGKKKTLGRFWKGAPGDSIFFGKPGGGGAIPRGGGEPPPPFNPGGGFGGAETPFPKCPPPHGRRGPPHAPPRAKWGRKEIKAGAPQIFNFSPARRSPKRSGFF